MDRKEGPSTRSVHTASRVDQPTGAIVPPMVNNASFAYQDLESWRRVALKESHGYIYSRNTNPTTDLFEEKIASLEGAESATSFATGMAAISCTLFALLSTSSRVVTVRDGQVYINAGSNSGIEAGDVLAVFRIGEELVDPETGLNLGQIEEKLGELEVAAVEEKFSIARTLGEFACERNDLVRYVKK